MDFHRFPQLFPKKGAPGEVWALEKTSSRDAEVAPVALPGKPMGKRREKGMEKMEKNWFTTEKKTRCSTRTRMQSRRTLLWNKLFEQSTFFPCYRTSAL